MKILYITKELPYGSGETFVYAELEKHIEAGTEITICPVLVKKTIHRKGKDFLDITLSEKIISYNIVRSFVTQVYKSPKLVIKTLLETIDTGNLKVSIRNISVWMKGVWLSQVVKERHIDHIHVHWIAVPATMAFIASKISNVPFSITAHRYDIAQRNIIDIKCSSAKFVRAIDLPGLKEISNQLKDGTPHPHLVRMGVHLPSVSASIRTGELKIIKGVIGARFMPKKGHSVLVEAVSLCRSKGIEVHIDCFGDGPTLDDIKKLCLVYGVQDLVNFMGVASHDELQSHLIFGGYDFAVLPSVTAENGDKEGIPVFLMEAMAACLPVISTPNGGISELITPSTGLLVPEYDAELLSEAIISLARCEDKRVSYSRAGRDYVHENFSIDGSMSKLICLINA